MGSVHYKNMNDRQRTAANRTIADRTLTHPRAVELRKQALEHTEESLPKLSSHDLREAFATVEALRETIEAPAAPEAPLVVAVPETILPTTDADDLRLAMLARFPIRGARPIQGVPTT
jgi:hypothetical protein